ncbi:hypothetical protein ABZP36_001661 [Zizania latifolia]
MQQTATTAQIRQERRRSWAERIPTAGRPRRARPTATPDNRPNRPHHQPRNPTNGQPCSSPSPYATYPNQAVPLPRRYISSAPYSPSSTSPKPPLPSSPFACSISLLLAGEISQPNKNSAAAGARQSSDTSTAAMAGLRMKALTVAAMAAALVASAAAAEAPAPAPTSDAAAALPFAAASLTAAAFGYLFC